MACPYARPVAGFDTAEPTTTAIVVQTVGWLLLGTLVGASIWVTGGELMRVKKGKA